MKQQFRALFLSLVACLAVAACGGGGGGSSGSAVPDGNGIAGGGGGTGGDGGDGGGAGGDGGDGSGDGTGGGDGGDDGRVFTISPGEAATTDAIEAFIAAGNGDTIEFDCGFFEFSEGLVLQNVEDITIRGCGIDETVLSFEDSNTVEGIQAINVRGLLIEDLTVTDTPGDGVKVIGSNFVTFLNMRAMWSSANNQVTADNFETATQIECPAYDPTGVIPLPYQTDSGNGRYAIYPVRSNNILMDNVEAIGASDAGIYVGQSNDVIMKNSRAAYNVAGYEIENTDRADMHDNLAECNTGGFLVFDLPNLSQYGDKTRVFNNVSRNNNVDNFAAGGIVGAVPKGTGMLILAYDEVEVFDNEIINNDSGGIIIVSHELIGFPNDRKIDAYAEAIHIRNNVMTNNGANPPPPNGTVADGEVTSLLPTLIRLKNPGGPVGANIVWDGLYDDDADDAVDGNPCPYPTDREGNPVPADERGEPQYRGSDPNPDCRYNDYKFDDSTDGSRERPEMFICIDDNNTYQNGLIPNFLNFKGVDEEIVGNNDITPHQCVAEYGNTLASLPAASVADFTPGGGGTTRPSEEAIAAACEADTGNGINRGAFDFDCPRLDQYNLFSDAADPTTGARENGTPFDLNTQLFSDYAQKYRFIFLPTENGVTVPAVYGDGGNGGSANSTYHFPVGTVIAKTFSFIDADNENVVETRLLIKRQNESGQQHWAGLPYIWTQDGEGNRIAELQLGGGSASVSWSFNDPQTGELTQGSTASYSIPHANQCVTCHGNDDRESGAAPIGPKPRNLNKPYPYESGLKNQIAHWRDEGLLIETPELVIDNTSMIATNIERLPVFDLPGSGGDTPGSDADIESRVRAYLEVNCAHCHNGNGVASNTGYFLDAFRDVDTSYGICKTPTAAGGGSGGRAFDIVPGEANGFLEGDGRGSILPFRMNTNDTEARMPPIARSVIHSEAVSLVENWINMVVDDSYEGAGDFRGCDDAPIAVP